MSKIISDIENSLYALQQSGNLRSLLSSQNFGTEIVVSGDRCLNFSSNDYLGIGADMNLQREFLSTIDLKNTFLLSNSSSRLMTGNAFYPDLEQRLSELYHGKHALVLGSGYLVNIGVLPAMTQKGDLIIADKLVHASIIDGLRLCECDVSRFRHNDLGHLEHILLKSGKNYRNIIVVTESVFSMDGDLAPIVELVKMKNKYGFQIYLDEAHAFGVYDNSGAGVAVSLGLDHEIDYIVATFGKAIASQGAFVACDPLIKRWLINKMRTLIFSTALPPISLLWSDFVISRLGAMDDKRRVLDRLKKIFVAELSMPEDITHIIPLMVGGAADTVTYAQRLRDQGFWVTPIRYPTVAKGSERLRISLTASLTEYDIMQLISKI